MTAEDRAMAVVAKYHGAILMPVALVEEIAAAIREAECAAYAKGVETMSKEIGQRGGG